jgi:DNA-binding transcriptional LysR family regulator
MRGAEYTELEAFAAVATNGSFAKAAQARGVATSTLSQSVRSLEQRLGVQLFHRTTRRVAMTVAGEQLLAQVQPALAELRIATSSVASLRNQPTGTLRLNVSNTLAAEGVSPLVARFLSTNPGINIEINIDDEIKKIVDGGFDAGIRHGSRVGLGMASTPISQKYRMLVFASPNYLAKYPALRTPEELQRHKCIRLRLADGTFFSWKFEKNGIPMEVAVNGPLTVNTNEFLLGAAVDGIGVIYISEQHTASLVEKGLLVPVLEDWSPPPIAYYLYYSARRRPSGPLRLFIDFLTMAFDENNACASERLTPIDDAFKRPAKGR